MIRLFSFDTLLVISTLVSGDMECVCGFCVKPHCPSSRLKCCNRSFGFRGVLSAIMSAAVANITCPIVSSLGSSGGHRVTCFRGVIHVATFIVFPITVNVVIVSPGFVSMVLASG